MKKNAAINRQIALEYEMGATCRELAQKYGSATMTIYRIVSAEGVHMRSSGPARNWIYPEAQRLADEQGLTAFDISQRCGYCEMYIMQLMRGTHPMTRKAAYKIAKALGGRDCDLFGVPDDRMEDAL